MSEDRVHLRRNSRVQLADSHLVYISTLIWRAGETARYDVYPVDGGHQLGWVWREHGTWVATSGDSTIGIGPRCRTRWEAATALWGHLRD